MKTITLIITLLFSSHCLANAASFKDGSILKGYGKHASVKQDLVLNNNAVFKVVFDTSEQGSEDEVNGRVNSVARFFNMHAANGILPENIQLALVVHGKASFDLLNNDNYQAKYSKNNPNDELLSLLLKNKVRIYLCGQSAAYYKIDNTNLHQGVHMALSAMTANAVLQREGYTLNPF
ncbi:MAG: intracellular sulfur oxidation DsrE/DsrF family protein [Alteromonadaceae bacterium]|jgi:intracellular sulfur oxidation DsrE/DsrF family protein